MAGGPLLLNLATPSGFELFILALVLVSAALIPALLTVRPAPRVEAPSKMSLLALYRSSPLGVIGGIGNGLVNGTFIGLTVVLAQRMCYSAADLALFSTIAVVGAGALQWPLGYLSDRFDRRTVLAVVILQVATVAFAGTYTDLTDKSTGLALMFIYGGVTIPLYSLILAHLNDYLRQDQMVAAASSYVFLIGTSATVGPIVTSWLMDRVGDGSFFAFQGVVLLASGGFAVWRMTQRPEVALADQTSPIYVARMSTLAATSAVEMAQVSYDETVQAA